MKTQKHIIPIGLASYEILFTDDQPKGHDFHVHTDMKKITVCRSSPAYAFEQAILAATRHEMPGFRAMPLAEISPQSDRAH